MKTKQCIKCGRDIEDGFLGSECRKRTLPGINIKKVTSAKKNFEREVSKAHKLGVSVIYDYNLQDLNVVTLHKYANEVDRNLAIDKCIYYFHKTLFFSSEPETQKELVKKWEDKLR